MNENRDFGAVEQIVAGVLAARKYRNVCADTVRRFAAEEWARRGPNNARRAGNPGRALAEAAKATRSRLHQAYGAYESRVDYARAYRDLESAYVTTGLGAVQSVCKRLLTLHASTRERLPILERLYGEVFAQTGLPEVLLDLACGLNPLSLPWMGLEEGATVYAYDIDRERIDFLNRYFALLGGPGMLSASDVASVPGTAVRPGMLGGLGMPIGLGRASASSATDGPGLALVHGRAFFQDILSQPPEQRGDVALLFKTSACLERQRAGATLALLDALRVRHVVVTFPVHSLGRRKRGMPEHYERSFGEMMADRPWPVTQLRFKTELVFIVEKG